MGWVTRVATAPTGSERPTTSVRDGSQYLLYEASIFLINLCLYCPRCSAQLRTAGVRLRSQALEETSPRSGIKIIIGLAYKINQADQIYQRQVAESTASSLIPLVLENRFFSSRGLPLRGETVLWFKCEEQLKIMQGKRRIEESGSLS